MVYPNTKVTYLIQFQFICNEAKLQLFERLKRELIKGDGKYIHGELKTWKERIKTSF